MGFKEFVKTAKGKIIVGVSGAAVVAVGIGVAVALQSSGYRTISCQEVGGTVTVTGAKNNGQAYAGEHLYSGDDVQVAEASELVLLMDLDKYVYADENTHFDLEASGSNEDSRIKINLYAGSELNDLQSKLGPNDTYEVDTPNSTMSVRGTRFRMTVYDGAANTTYTLLEVDEGEVNVKLKTKDGKYNGIEKSFKAGESVLIKGDFDISEFVLGEDGNEVRHLDYDKLPEGNVDRLIELLKVEGEAGSDGSDDALETEKPKAADDTHVHKAGAWEITKQPTCTEAGEQVKKCDCGEIMETESIPATGHTEGEWQITKKATCLNSGTQQLVCAVCGEVMDTASIPATGHQPGDWSAVKSATCTQAGYEEQYCALCGELLGSRQVMPKGHVSGGREDHGTITCDVGGFYDEYCAICGELIDAGTTPAMGHDWCAGGSYTDIQPVFGPPVGQGAAAPHLGNNYITYTEYTCSRCGATETRQTGSYFVPVE